MTTLTVETVLISELQAKQICADSSPFRPVLLVVDDERVIADTLVVILNNAGYAASAAYDAQSALAMAQIVPPELLVSDVVMPGMSGVELAVAMKDIVPDCRTLLFSGQAATADMLLHARKSGHEFTLLAKPVHPHDLLAQVSQLNRPSRRVLPST
jgi:DNA-binding NtrC family response regulator